MNKPVFLGLLIMGISKIVMYELWYDFVKPKHGKKAKLCYTDTDSFVAYIKNRRHLPRHCKRCLVRFDISNYEIESPLPKGKGKNVIGLMKNESGGKIMKEFASWRAKIYSYLIDNNDEDKKAKGTKQKSVPWKKAT